MHWSSLKVINSRMHQSPILEARLQGTSSRPKTLHRPSPRPPGRAPFRRPRCHNPFWGPGGSPPSWFFRFFIFSFCSLRNWRTSFHPSAPGEESKSTFPTVLSNKSINLFTSASSVEGRVGIVGNGCTLGPKSYHSSLRPNLRLAGPYPDPAWHTTSAELGSQQSRLLVGWRRHHSATKHSQWDAIRKRSFGLFLVTDCGGFAVFPKRFHWLIRSLPQLRESPSISSFLTFEGHISQTSRWHSFSTLIPRRHSQTYSQRRCLGHTSFSMHGDRRVYSVPRFQPGIDPLIGHPSRNGKMPVYRAPYICSSIHGDTSTSMVRGPSARPPNPSFYY